MSLPAVTNSQADILLELEKAAGQAWTVEHIDTAEDIAVGKQLLAAGYEFGVFKLVQAVFWGNLPGMRQNFEVDDKKDLVNGVLSIESSSVGAVVKDVLASQP